MNAIATLECLPSQNEGWGFLGTISTDGRLDPQAAWRDASAAVSAATEISAEGARAFLDSRHGRHFADAVLDWVNRGETLQAAVEAAAEEWMSWRISRTTSRHTGIPAGLPYLTGFAYDAHFSTF